jgi:hypothetical protein
MELKTPLLLVSTLAFQLVSKKYTKEMSLDEMTVDKVRCNFNLSFRVVFQIALSSTNDIIVCVAPLYIHTHIQIYIYIFIYIYIT